MNAEQTMNQRRKLAASFYADKAAAMVAGDYVELRKLMELTDDIMSGRMDAEPSGLTDDELLAELMA